MVLIARAHVAIQLPKEGPIRELMWADPDNDSVRAGKKAGDMPTSYDLSRLKKRDEKVEASQVV